MGVFTHKKTPSCFTQGEVFGLSAHSLRASKKEIAIFSFVPFSRSFPSVIRSFPNATLLLGYPMTIHCVPLAHDTDTAITYMVCDDCILKYSTTSFR